MSESSCSGRKIYELAHAAGISPIHITAPMDWEDQPLFIRSAWDKFAAMVIYDYLPHNE